MNLENKIVLSYYDCLLRQSDVNLLIGTNWINDAIIGFYFEYLGKNLDFPHSAKILYASPELTQLLKLTDSSEISIFLDPLDATQRDFIFFPLNDCRQRNSAGGSHWSLLVFSKQEGSYFHFDSSRKLNENNARKFAENLSKYLIGKEGKFVESNCPQQENSYDCGIFVMCVADILTEYVSNHSKIEGHSLANVKKIVSEKRKSLIELINRFQKE